MDSFTVRDLRERTGELIRQAEAGNLVLVTKHGRPVFVGIPLEERLLREGVDLALALKLYEEDVVSLGKAARLANLSVSKFLNKLSSLGIDAVRYPPEEIEEEITAME